MRMQRAPESCTACRSNRLVALLWNYSRFSEEETEAIAAERAYLGLSHRYFTSVDPTLVVGRLFAKQSELPTWACLDCAPEWVEVHRLTGEERRAWVSIEAAVEAHDFENAAVQFDRQRRLEAAYLPRYDQLLRELIASKGTRPQRA